MKTRVHLVLWSDSELGFEWQPLPVMVLALYAANSTSKINVFYFGVSGDCKQRTCPCNSRPWITGGRIRPEQAELLSMKFSIDQLTASMQ